MSSLRTLGEAGYRRARKFVQERARPIDKAWFAYSFEDGKAEAVWEALTAFANDDGGFGRGMEPDCQLPASSVLATGTAFGYLTQTGAASDHPLVANGIRYLIDQYNRALQGWPMLPPDVNDHPRASWWNYKPEKAEAEIVNHWSNPSAGVVAILHRYSRLVPVALLQEVTNKAMGVFAESIGRSKEHDYLPWIPLAEALPAPLAGSIWTGLKQQASAAVVTDPIKWTSYGVRPLWAVSEPSSPLYGVLRAAADAHLDFEIDRQDSDGSWHPFWSWGQFNDEWQAAKVAWQGYLTVKMLRIFKAFGRIG